MTTVAEVEEAGVTVVTAADLEIEAAAVTAVVVAAVRVAHGGPRG